MKSLMPLPCIYDKYEATASRWSKGNKILLPAPLKLTNKQFISCTKKTKYKKSNFSFRVVMCLTNITHLTNQYAGKGSQPRNGLNKQDIMR